ncbi:hypothetical protein ASG17_10600 [Brevundimonas sp. Leaf363]|uniref:hypothetical protein n=1 Tax=Brevundimonas sp. Leaf363 TaxID=1736353 RepID=UPI0006F3D994|nr:hypothetical protein [Brevundimonas sp. Leaf363]KQS56430.1 hypothetical protein ASG17_10600 [Brevundimonas sp. Leaf363]
MSLSPCRAGDNWIEPGDSEGMNDVSEPSTKIVLADRSDGLGQRILSILKAMNLAQIMGVNYAFTWDHKDLEHHALPAAADVFTADYLAAHIVENPTDFFELSQPIADRAHMDKAAEGLKGWSLKSSTAYRRLPTELRRSPPGTYAALFDGIGFRRYIRKAILAARQVKLAERPVAIHLRAGDIIYGSYRFRDQFTRKVVALPVARWLIEHWRAAGRTVVLFAQDPEVAAQYRDQADVIVAADLSERFATPIQRALFEITLMSRCAEIHAGFSAFAHVAARIGDFKAKAPRDSLPLEQQVDVIRTALADPTVRQRDPRLQTAFAAWAAADVLLEQQRWSDALPLLERAVADDPVNGFYRVKLASSLYRLERDAEADAVMAAALESQNRSIRKARQIALAALKETSGKGFTLQSDREIFAEASSRGSEQARRLADLTAR